MAAPVEGSTTVTSVRAAGDGYDVVTDRGPWRCRTVVLATGACNAPSVPALAAGIPAAIRQVTPFDYRGPSDLVEGGVLVVGASATGIQLADEIHRSGRPVTIAVGEHVRAPRTYRGRDIQWWMDAAGVLDDRYDEVDDIVRARGLPSPQLVGSPERRTIDLNSLSHMGVRLVGRFADVRGGRALFSGALRNVAALADLKLGRLLDRIDEWAVTSGLDDDVPPPHRMAATEVDASPAVELDLTTGEIRTIVWATGFRPDHSWLDVPVVDRRGRIRHDGGVIEAPGMYLLGAPFLRRRKSSFIHGAEDDVADLSARLAAHLAGSRRAVTTSSATPRTPEIRGR